MTVCDTFYTCLSDLSRTRTRLCIESHCTILIAGLEIVCEFVFAKLYWMAQYTKHSMQLYAADVDVLL